MNERTYTLAIAIFAIVLSVLAIVKPDPATARPKLGVTNFDSIHLSDTNGTATPNLIANQVGTGAILEVRDASTPVFQIANGGQADFAGNQIDLDADNDTSITVDTDDRIDFEVGGTDRLQISVMGLVFSEASALTLAADGIITPTTTYQPITATTAITLESSFAIADGTVTGQVLVIVNESDNDIIIPDSANTNISGAATLGTDDTIWLIWDSADWLEIAQTDN